MKSFSRTLLVVLVPALALSACGVEIQHDLSEREANEILVLLERKNISVKKEKEEGGREVTWKISVPKAYAAKAAILLRENELPRPHTPGMEIFNKGSLIPTATEERAMYLQALQGDLGRTISSIDGILDSRVHLNIPMTDDLSDRSEKPAPSASVLVRYRAYTEPGKKAPPPPITIEQVQDLVARAVQDLSAKNVSVVMTPAAMPGGLEGGPTSVVLLGIKMDSESVSAFQAVLATLILIILALAGYIVFIKTRELKPVAPPRRGRTEA